MASPDVLDFEKLLGPVREDQPAGVETRRDPQASQLFNAIRAARESARTSEQSIFEHSYLPHDGDDANRPPEPSRPNWAAVRDPAIELLGDHSKDLWVAVWLTESLARLNGFAGLRDGFRLLRELADRYWGQLHPLPDPDDDETVELTLSQLGGFNNQIGKPLDPIDQIPITSETRSWPPMTSFDYKVAMNSSGGPAGEYPDGSPRPTLDSFDSAVREADRSFFEDLRDDVRSAQEEFQKLVEILDARCGDDDSGFSMTPPTSSITKSLAEARERVEKLTAWMFQTEEGATPDDEGVGEEGQAAPGASAPKTAPGKITNREDAFRELTRVADYFRRTEPHSPISFTLDQVVRWGHMSLPELLRELIPNSEARGEMFRRTGIPTVEDDG